MSSRRFIGNTLKNWMGGLKFMNHSQRSTHPSPLQACFVQQCGCDRRQHITPGSLCSYSTSLIKLLHIYYHMNCYLKEKYCSGFQRQTKPRSRNQDSLHDEVQADCCQRTAREEIRIVDRCLFLFNDFCVHCWLCLKCNIFPFCKNQVGQSWPPWEVSSRCGSPSRSMKKEAGHR